MYLDTPRSRARYLACLWSPLMLPLGIESRDVVVCCRRARGRFMATRFASWSAPDDPAKPATAAGFATSRMFIGDVIHARLHRGARPTLSAHSVRSKERRCPGDGCSIAPKLP
ncbi:hypothetical protein K456DRAFT_44944 [Colletotrichum gloeosporioides 23]|nr:hypothetical protein K456DRAFT_44944 [Colletotrichum gloeosporioides 23]